MRRIGRALVVVGILCLGFACSPFGASDDSDPSDAGKSTDTGTSDGGPTTSDGGGPTAGDAGDDDPCVGAPAFCDDFERAPTALLGPWATLTDSGRGDTLTLDGDHATSGKSALHATLPANDAGAAYSHLSRDLKLGGATKVKLSFRFFPSDPHRHANLATLSFVGDDGTSHLVLGVENTGIFVGRLSDDSAYQTFNQFSAVRTNDWNHVVAVIDLAQSPPALTVTLNDGPVGLNSPAALDPSSDPKTLFLFAGSDYGSLGDSVELWYDDVRVDLAP